MGSLGATEEPVGRSSSRNASDVPKEVITGNKKGKIFKGLENIIKGKDPLRCGGKESAYKEKDQTRRG